VTVDLAELLGRGAAVITVECQQGVIGPRGPLPALLEAVLASRLLEGGGRLLRAARGAGLPVLHGTVVRRADGGGVVENCRLFTVTAKSAAPPLLEGTEAQKVVEEFGPAPSDWEIARHHGVSLFHDTELDAILRSLGVETVILIGVSLNIAVLGTTIEAVNRGYRVVVPRDAVVGTPPEYAEAVLRNSLALLATLSTCDDLIDALGSLEDR
jgi:nicotinamidase-related amidase